MNILITGGLGYVGGRLSDYFTKEKGFTVYALSRNKSIEGQGFQVLSNDSVLKQNALDEVKIDVLIHLAASNEIESAKDPQKSNEVNINGTVQWLEWAKQNKVGQFIYFSTVHVYSRPLLGFFEEESATNPMHPYSINHKCAEDYCNWYRLDHGLNTKIVRLSNSFGYPAFPTANRWTLFINDICKQIAEGNPITIHSNIKQHRDFIPLADVCSAVDSIIHHESNEVSLYNLSNGSSKSLEEIAIWVKNIAEKHLNKSIDIVFDPKKSSDSEQVKISNQRLKDIGWQVNWDGASKEITKTIDFFLNKEAG